MRQWRLIRSGPARGARNMAIDEALLIDVTDRPVLRFYGWNPHCLSLGYGQHSRDVDQDRLQATGHSLVRRPSGGGAILHAEELTWSLVLPAGHPLAVGSLLTGYRRVAEVWWAALRSLDIPVEICQEGAGPGGGMVCFESRAPFELAAAGRKLLGSARVQRRHAMLQHGSLPLSGDVAAICDYLVYPEEKARRNAAARLRSQATTLSQAAGSRAIDLDSVIAAVVDAFRGMHGVCVQESSLTGAEQDRAEALERGRFGNMDWVLRR